MGFTQHSPQGEVPVSPSQQPPRGLRWVPQLIGKMSSLVSGNHTCTDAGVHSPDGAIPL